MSYDFRSNYICREIIRTPLSTSYKPKHAICLLYKSINYLLINFQKVTQSLLWTVKGIFAFHIYY
jgi:hypothetical protein